MFTTNPNVFVTDQEYLKQISIDDYKNPYNRKIDVDVLEEGEIAFMVKTNRKDFDAVVYESHLTDYDTVSYTVYLKRPDGNLELQDGGEIDVRMPRFTIFDLFGLSTFNHSRKSKDVILLDWSELKEVC